MKKTNLLLLFGFTLKLYAQDGISGGTPNGPGNSNAVGFAAFAIKERGPHHSIWQRVTSTTNTQGRIIRRTDSFTELATGLHYWNGTAWADSSPLIQITPTGAAATNGQHQVNFAANLNTAGSVDLAMPDGRHLRSQIVGLAYFDNATSNSVMFAETKDCTGQLVSSSNQVVYTNAFTDVQADVRYTHRRKGMEQDVILRSQPPPPEQFGLSSQTTFMQIWTEFLDPVEPTVSSKQIAVDGGAIRQKLNDQTLDFSSMQIGRGKAFSTDSDVDELAAVPVVKEWVHTGGRIFLVEQVPINVVAEQLQKLPPSPPAVTNGASGSGGAGASLHLKLPAPKLQAKARRPMELAREDSKFQRGFLLDYLITDSTLTDYTFQADTTYCIMDDLDLYGTTVIEGGTVIKCGTNYDGNTVHGGLVSLTAPYRPAVFTVTNDNSVGTALAPSGTSPTLAVTTYLSLLEGGSITNMRFSYAWNALGGWADDVEVTDCQFIDCNHPITINSDTTTLGLHNLLITMDDSINTSANFCSCQPGALTIYSQAVNIFAENVTADLGSQYLMMYFMTLGSPLSTTVNFTNSIIISPSLTAHRWTGGTYAVIANTNTCFYATTLPSGLFTNVGAAGHYLVTNSLYRGNGNPNISAGLLADLATKTTWPPMVYDGGIGGSNVTATLNLSTNVLRDTTGTPDRGYHYDPIDYAFGCVVVSNATITLNPGTVVAAFMSSSGSGSFSSRFGYPAAGLGIDGTAQLIAQGTPINPARIVCYNNVQEQSTSSWSTPPSLLDVYYRTFAPAPGLNCEFADFATLAYQSYSLYQDVPGTGSVGAPPMGFQNTQFHGGGINTFFPAIALTNCLFERVDFEPTCLDGTPSFIQNNLFYGGTFSPSIAEVDPVVFYNLCDQTSLPGDYLWGTNNAYYPAITGATDGGYNDYIFTSPPVYQIGPLGRFYQTNTSPLIDRGNVTADVVGLYHYTTQANQTNEAFTMVDIGFHYVAVDGNGNPIDTNTDGTPDYLEDANGDGYQDNGETDWMVMLNGQGGITGLQVFTPLKY